MKTYRCARWAVGALALLWLCMCLPVYAVESCVRHVFDQAELLTQQQSEAVEVQIADLQQTLQADIVVLTVKDTQGKDARTYAQAFYDENGFGNGADRSGMLLSIDMDQQTLCLIVRGKMAQIFTEDQQQVLLSGVREACKTSYETGMGAFLTQARAIAQAYGPTATPALHAQEQRVFDDADLFTAAQEQALEDSAAALRAQMNMDVVIVTTADAKGKSARAYADDYYDDNGFGVGKRDDGVLFLIDMDNREAYISTCGNMIDLLTDGRIDSMLDGVVPNLQQKDYAGAAQAFLSQTQTYFEAGPVYGQYQYDTETGERTDANKFPYALRIVICVAVAAIAGGITVWSVKSRYSMKTEAYTYPYRDKSALSLYVQQDRFLHQTLTSRQIPKPQSSAGSSGSSMQRSSTHRSSSGRSHGGGGRKF